MNPMWFKIYNRSEVNSDVRLLQIRKLFDFFATNARILLKILSEVTANSQIEILIFKPHIRKVLEY